MIDTDWIDELDGSSAADALVRVSDELRAVEAKRLLMAAHWADLHAAEELLPAELALSPTHSSAPDAGNGSRPIESGHGTW